MHGEGEKTLPSGTRLAHLARRLLALERLLQETPYATYHKVPTMTADGTQVYDEGNLVILSRFETIEHRSCKHD